MPRDFTRSRRVEEQIQRVVSDILRTEVRDPRLNAVIVTRVKASRDLSVAWIYYSAMATGSEPADMSGISDALAKAAAFIRRQLARELKVRAVPELRFQVDDALERASELDALIDQAVAADRSSPTADSDPDDDSKS